MYQVITVTENPEWRQFVAVQRRIYRRQPAAIPLPEFELRRLLDRRGNPVLQRRTLYLLLVLRDGDPVGRCSLLLPRGSEQTTALFGFFECVHDQRAADALLARVEELCAARGVRVLHGPFSPDTAGLTGVQLDRFDDANVLGEPCALPYYARLLEDAGYTIEQKGRTWRSTTLREDATALAAALPQRRSRFRLQSVERDTLQEGIGDLAAVFDDAFLENWSRDAMSREEYFYNAQYLLPAWIDDGMGIVYDDVQPVGAIVFMADINPAFRHAQRLPRALALLRARRHARKTRRIVAFAMGMLPEYQNSAAGLQLVRHFADVALRYDCMHTTWITEGNQGSERICARFGLQPWRQFGVFRKNL
jgi:hypothetical protein